MRDPQLYFSKEFSESTIGMIAMQAQCSRYSLQPAYSSCSAEYIGCALMLERLFGHAFVPAWCADMLDAGTIVWVCMCIGVLALMLELLFGHLSVSVRAGG